MPQINQLAFVYQSQWFWLAIVLAVIYFGIGKGMLPKIEATVDLRDRKIADDLRAAKKQARRCSTGEGHAGDGEKDSKAGSEKVHIEKDQTMREA